MVLVEVVGIILWLIFFLPGIIIGILGLIIFAYCLLVLFSIVNLLLGFYLFIWHPYKNNGQTIGMKKRNIRIMVIENEDSMTFRLITKGDFLRLFYRTIIMFYESSFLLGVIPWYLITNQTNHQIIADLIANTVVVQIDSESTSSLKQS